MCASRVGEHAVLNQACPIGGRQQGHPLGLQVGGDAGIGLRDDIDRPGAIPGFDGDPVLPSLDLDARCPEANKHRAKMLRDNLVTLTEPR